MESELTKHRTGFDNQIINCILNGNNMSGRIILL